MGLNLHIVPINNPTVANKCPLHVNTKIRTLYPSLSTYFHVLMAVLHSLQESLLMCALIFFVRFFSISI